MNRKYRSHHASTFFFRLFGWRSALALVVMACASSASATPIALWTFETSPPASATNFATYPNAISPDSGVGSGNAGGTHVSTGTDWTSPGGNGSLTSFSSNQWGQFDWFQFTVNTTGYQDITLSWDQTRSSTSAPGFFTLSYSSAGTGGPFTAGLSGYTVLTNDAIGLPVRTAWSNVTYQSQYTFSLNLSAISALDNNANVVFRLIADVAGTNANATVRVDNFLVSGVAIPEPSSALLAASGVVVVAIARRSRLRPRQTN